MGQFPTEEMKEDLRQRRGGFIKSHVDYAPHEENVPENRGVIRELVELQSELEFLEKMIHVLGEKIDPILLPVESLPADKANEPARSYFNKSSIATALQEKTETVRKLRSRVSAISERVDV